MYLVVVVVVFYSLLLFFNPQSLPKNIVKKVVGTRESDETLNIYQYELDEYRTLTPFLLSISLYDFLITTLYLYSIMRKKGKG